MNVTVKEGECTIRRNKSTNEGDPPYRGGIMIGGVVMNLDLWVYEKDGERYFHGTVKVVDHIRK